MLSTELLGLYLLKSFEEISFLTNSVIPPPELFLSSRKGTLKPSIANWLEGKDYLLLFLRPAKCLIYP